MTPEGSSNETSIFHEIPEGGSFPDPDDPGKKCSVDSILGSERCPHARVMNVEMTCQAANPPNTSGRTPRFFGVSIMVAIHLFSEKMASHFLPSGKLT